MIDVEHRRSLWHMRLARVGLCCAVLALAACTSENEMVTRGALSESGMVHTQETPPPNALEGTCWGRHATPAKIETVTHQILMQPAALHSDGRISAPAIYRTETLHQITKERRELWFETPCAPELTVEFVSSLQRALEARGHYRGAISGYLDTRTRRAIRKYQAAQGLNSDMLSLAAARKLGLSAYGRREQ